MNSNMNLLDVSGGSVGQDVDLADGSYTFNAIDSWGDGWGCSGWGCSSGYGYWNITDASGTDAGDNVLQEDGLSKILVDGSNIFTHGSLIKFHEGEKVRDMVRVEGLGRSSQYR